MRVTDAVPSIEILLPLLAWHRMELLGIGLPGGNCGKDHDHPKNHFVSPHAKILQQTSCGPAEQQVRGCANQFQENSQAVRLTSN
jgi:hypothetical protein